MKTMYQTILFYFQTFTLRGIRLLFFCLHICINMKHSCLNSKMALFYPFHGILLSCMSFSSESATATTYFFKGVRSTCFTRLQETDNSRSTQNHEFMEWLNPFLQLALLKNVVISNGLLRCKNHWNPLLKRFSIGISNDTNRMQICCCWFFSNG